MGALSVDGRNAAVGARAADCTGRVVGRRRAAKTPVHVYDTLGSAKLEILQCTVTAGNAYW